MIPKTRTEWWTAKIQSNKDRDRKAFKELKKLGWRVIEVWECDLRKQEIKSRLLQFNDSQELKLFIIT